MDKSTLVEEITASLCEHMGRENFAHVLNGYEIGFLRQCQKHIKIQYFATQKISEVASMQAFFSFQAKQFKGKR